MSTVTNSAVEHLYIVGANCLDPINVFFEDFGPGRGEVTINCYGDAWTCYWGGMGKENIREFFLAAGNDYLTNKLLGHQHKRTKAHEKYLARICDAIKEALRDRAAGEG